MSYRANSAIGCKLVYVLSTLFRREGYWIFCQHRLHMSLQYLSLSENRPRSLCQNPAGPRFPTYRVLQLGTLPTSLYSLPICTVVMRYSCLSGVKWNKQSGTKLQSWKALVRSAFCGKVNTEELPPPHHSVQLDLHSWSDGEGLD